MQALEDIEIKRAYTEVLEILYNIPQWQLNKIPFDIIRNIEVNKDKEYLFEYDTSKSLDEQEISIIAQGIILNLYREYLKLDNENELWNRYDRICYNIEEQNKREKYDLDVFKNKKEIKKSYEKMEKNDEKQLIIKESILKRMINKIKKIFQKRRK